MIHGNRYTEDLEWVVRKFEKALKEINEKCVHYDSKGQEINGNEIGEIVIKALDINAEFEQTVKLKGFFYKEGEENDEKHRIDKQSDPRIRMVVLR